MRLSEKIRQRIEKELRSQVKILEDDNLIDEVFATTLDKLDGHVREIVSDLVAQRVAIGKRKEIRETQRDSIDRQADHATIALNLNRIEFPRNVDLMVEHLELIRPNTLSEALSKMPRDILVSIREMISQLLDEEA